MLTTESLRCQIRTRLSIVATTLLLLFGCSSGKMEAQRLALASRTFGDSSGSIGMVDVGVVEVDVGVFFYIIMMK